MAYKYNESRRAAYSSYEGTFTDSPKGVLSEEDQTVYDMILDEYRRKDVEDGYRWVVRRRYRGPRAHRWQTESARQSMCHRRDSTHFDIYVYQERI